jgi:predicted nucleic acid-binding Zn ribbon protein
VADDEPRRMGELLDRVVRGLGGPSADAMIEVFGHWEAVAGERLSEHCRPRELRGETLVVVATDPVWATEVRYRQEVLLDGLAQRLGRRIVTRVEVGVDPPP